MRVQERIRFGSYINTDEDCWNWKGPQFLSGYGLFHGVINGERRNYRAHRVSLVATDNLDIKSKSVVMHLCNNKLCVRPSHLEIGTQRSNIDMACRDGLVAKKLNEIDINQIKFLLSVGDSAESISRLFGVSRQTINDIAADRTWKWVK